MSADIEAIVARAEASEAQRAVDMPDEQSAIRAMWSGYQRLRELGWREACYCPKDGSAFEVIEAGSTGIHRCTYSGEWPTGTYWVEDAKDWWPSRPVLFRLSRSPYWRPAMSAELNLLDTDGENLAVRAFLMQWGVPSLTVGQMIQHMRRSGFDGCWPDWVMLQKGIAHLTKGGAGDWIRHLFALEAAAPAQAEPSGALSGSFDIAIAGSRIAFDGEVWTLPATYKQLVPVAQELARRCAYAKQAIEARGALSDAKILNLSEDFKRNYHACGADVEEFDALGFAKALLGILGQPLFSDKKLD